MTILLTALVSFGAISNNMYLPSMPAMARDLATSDAGVMLTLSAFLVGFGGGQLIHGPLSDRFGRRPILIAGLVLYAVAAGVSVAAPDIELLLAARFILGLGAAAAQVLPRAVVRDIYDPASAARVLSIMAAVFSIAPAAAPFIGGLLDPVIGWRGIFAVQLAIGLAALCAVLIGFGESLREKDLTAMQPRRMAANYGTLLANRAFLGHALCVAFLFAGMFAFHSGSAFVLIEMMGISTQLYGVLFMIVVGGYVTGTVISARITMRFGMARMIVAGTSIALGGAGLMLTLALVGVGGAAAIIGPMTVFLFGFGIATPNAIAAAIGPFPEKAGSASAMVGFMQQGAGATMAVMLGALANGTQLPMVSCLFGGTLFAVCVYWLLAADARR
jgi:DHA1 family bicyclomycin/chloramphenicol resistance-like MFS transporter